jgi:hypothetical protein
MTDTSSQSAVASVVPQRNSDATMVTDPAVALRTLFHAIGACELYYAYLADHVFEHPICDIAQDLRDCYYDRLITLEALVVMAFVWKESPCITDSDLACAGFTRSFPKGITRNALGNALQKSDRRPPSYQSAAMFARRAQRIVEAAIAYGLVEEGKCSPNRKPLFATKRLHDLMAEVGSAAAVLLLEPFAGVACDLACPGEDGTGGGAT